jgi:hypothetical protein
MRIGELQQSKYLKKDDFPQAKICTIKDVTVENVAQPGQAKKDRGVMYFREVDKGLVMNSTNLKRAAHFLGSEETDDWIGKKIVVYNDPNIEFGGDIVGGLRLKGAPKPGQQPQQKRPAAEAMEGLDDDLPWEDTGSNS